MRRAAALAALLVSALPASAVMRHSPLDSPPDTLVLQPKEARDFRLRRLAGSDLHHAGLYLGVASVPLVLLTPWVADRFGLGSPVADLEEGFFLLTFAALPALSAVMASGNLAYASAARYHPERDFAITRSPAPLAAFAFAAGKLFYFATHPGLADADGTEKGILYALAFTELLTVPVLRSQFNAASVFLDQVQIRVTGAGPGLGFRADF